MTQSWQDIAERSTPLALKSVRWIALKLGRSQARLFLYPITLYFLLFAPLQRRASLHYLQRVLDHKPNWFHVAKHIHCFASTILDRVYMLTGQFDQLDIVFPEENLPLTFVEKGTPCILLGGHIGCPEILKSYAIRNCSLPFKILLAEEQTPMIARIMNELNSELKEQIIPLGTSGSLLRVKDAIDAGYSVGMLGDRIIGDEKTVRCTLLGDEVTVSASTVIISAALKLPVVMFFGIYLGGNRYQIHFELLSEQINLNRKDRMTEVHALVQRYVSTMETQIRAAPYNWFNFYDYWDDESEL